MQRVISPAAILRSYTFALTLMSEDEAIEAVAQAFDIEPSEVCEALGQAIA